MKKIFTTIILCAVAFVGVRAQSIPNGSFESWENAGSTYQSTSGSMDGGKTAFGLRGRPGTEPVSWEGSSVNQKVLMEKKATLITESGYNGKAVKMTNAYVGVLSVGANAPAFINFATPWVYAMGDVNKCDGGVYGGLSFTHRPDAIEGWYKRTTGSEGEENAHIIVYLWNGTFKSNIKSSIATGDTKDDVDRAVMGMDTDLKQRGTLIAKCDYAFTSTTNNDWQKIVVPLEYVEGTDNVAPEKVNVIISSGDYWTRANIRNGNVLEADDVKFLYYSELKSLVYNGVNIPVAGKTSFEINEEYNESKLAVTSNGKGATIEKSYNQSTKVLTITIKGNNYNEDRSNVHTYTVKFKGGDVVGPDPEIPTPNPDTDANYVPAFTGTKTRIGRNIESVTLESAAYAGEVANILVVDNSENPCFVDYTSSVTMKADKGETVTVNVNIGEASWINAYVYVDKDANGFNAGIADNSNWAPTGDLVSYSFYNNNASSDNLGWDSAGRSITDNARSTVLLPQFAVPSVPGTYRVRVKLDWCNIDPNGDQDGKFGDFMDNGGQIVDFMLEVVGDEVVEPEPEPNPDEDGYTPDFTGVKTSVHTDRWIYGVTLESAEYADEASNTLEVDNYDRLCYNDYSGSVTMKAAAGETVTVNVNIGESSWLNAYLYIDADADGFTAGIAQGSDWAPTGDLVSYSFYNNNASSDNSGWNSVGRSMTENARSTVALPEFAVPSVPGTYRVRVKTDWCNIDPDGDRDGKFGDFMENGGQIVDFMLEVTDSATSIDELFEENLENAVIYDLSGRRVENPGRGIYIVNGHKVLIK